MRTLKVYKENEEKAITVLKAAGFEAKVVTRWTEAGENMETGNRWSVSFAEIETDCSGNRAHALWVAAGVVPENPNFKTREYGNKVKVPAMIREARAKGVETHPVEASCTCTHCTTYQRCGAKWRFVAHWVGARTPTKVAQSSKTTRLYFEPYLDDDQRVFGVVTDEIEDPYGFGETEDLAILDLFLNTD